MALLRDIAPTNQKGGSPPPPFSRGIYAARSDRSCAPSPCTQGESRGGGWRPSSAHTRSACHHGFQVPSLRDIRVQLWL